MLSELSWLPPCQLLVGSVEALLADSRNVVGKLRREDVPPSYTEYDGMVHVLTLCSSFLPEGREALEQIGAFVNDHVLVS